MDHRSQKTFDLQELNENHLKSPVSDSHRTLVVPFDQHKFDLLNQN